MRQRKGKGFQAEEEQVQNYRDMKEHSGFGKGENCTVAGIEETGGGREGVETNGIMVNQVGRLHWAALWRVITLRYLGFILKEMESPHGFQAGTCKFDS